MSISRLPSNLTPSIPCVRIKIRGWPLENGVGCVSSLRREKVGDRLSELCRKLLKERHLIVASNRGPVEYHTVEGDELKAIQGSGGVATALSSLARYGEFTWVACAMGEGDRRAAEMAQGGHLWAPLPGHKLDLRFVTLPKPAYHKYYSIFCNPLLWFLQHYMWDIAYTPHIDKKNHDAWRNGYIPANQAFAEAILDEAKRKGLPPLIMLHDYHLYLVSGYIRERMPAAIIQHFIHIPWPAPRYWQLLPECMYQAILRGLCAADIVGLQIRRDAQNFLHCCQVLLPEAEVDYQGSTVRINEHLTRAIPYPVSIDAAELRKLSQSPRVKRYETKLRPYLGEQTIVRVDRVEPSKNIVRGLKAFELLLEKYSQFRGKVKFLSFLVPSRSHIEQYRRYAKGIKESVVAINAKYGDEHWQPIKVFYEDNRLQAIAGMRLYDVLLVNSIFDGMNLVAKEGPIVNTRDGVLILSEGTGAHEQLGEYALSVAATDVEGTAQALYAALTMSPAERGRRAQALRESIEAEDITYWFYRQFRDIEALLGKQPPLAREESAPHQLLPEGLSLPGLLPEAGLLEQ
jgi:trehalose 6-phosphate synthase